MSFKKLISDCKVIVCIGSGGVGKTTVSAALAVTAAKEGKRVLVLTVDPAKRLATTMGIEGESDIARVPNQNYKGELFAGVINPKKIFDDFILKASNRAPSALRLLNNKLYQQVSTTLSGSQEFTAIEKLYSCYDSGDFDLIILDTPPSKHAIDFLEAPKKISALFSEKVAKWFRDPFANKSGLISKIAHQATGQALKTLEAVTGAEFIKELADIFEKIQGWEDKLNKRTLDVDRLLKSDQTKFFLVTAFDEAKLREAEGLSNQIKSLGYHLSEIIINRAIPDFDIVQQIEKEGSVSNRVLNDYKKILAYYTSREKLYSNFITKMSDKCGIIRLPEFRENLYDLSGVERLADILSDVSSDGVLK